MNKRKLDKWDALVIEHREREKKLIEEIETLRRQNYELRHPTSPAPTPSSEGIQDRLRDWRLAEERKTDSATPAPHAAGGGGLRR